MHDMHKCMPPDYSGDSGITGQGMERVKVKANHLSNPAIPIAVHD